MIMATIVMKNLRELEEGRALEQGSGILPGLRALVNRAEVMIINYMKVFGARASLMLASENLCEKVRAGEVRTKLLDPKLTENMVGKYFWIPGIMVAWEVYFHLKVENLNNKTGDSTSCVQVDNNNKIKALIKIGNPSIHCNALV